MTDKTLKDIMTEKAIELKNTAGIPAVRDVFNKHADGATLARIPESKQAEVIDALDKALAAAAIKDKSKVVTRPTLTVKEKAKAGKRKVGKHPALGVPYGFHLVHPATFGKIKADHRGPDMTHFGIGLPGDLHSNTVKLVLDFANVMGQKLRASELKHGYEDEWMQDVQGGGFESDDVLPAARRARRRYPAPAPVQCPRRAGWRDRAGQTAACSPEERDTRR